jgi:HPt (histidine-containing phosphotransfer) domain-containing protein
LIDAPTLLAACGDDAVVLEKICLALKAQLPRELERVRQALDAQDLADLREAAHRVAGMVSAVSTIAGRTASDIEDGAALGRAIELSELVGRLEAQISDVLEALGSVSLERLHDGWNDLELDGHDSSS